MHDQNQWVTWSIHSPGMMEWEDTVNFFSIDECFEHSGQLKCSSSWSRTSHSRNAISSQNTNVYWDIGGENEPLVRCSQSADLTKQLQTQYWCEVREKTNKMQQLDVYFQQFLNMFRASLCPSSGKQDYVTACGVLRCNKRGKLDISFNVFFVWYCVVNLDGISCVYETTPHSHIHTRSHLVYYTIPHKKDIKANI